MTAKMTPGPWQTGIGESSVWAGEWRVTSSIRMPADARAIACLPELIQESKAVLEQIDAWFELGDAASEPPDTSDLRRILARIDGGD